MWLTLAGDDVATQYDATRLSTDDAARVCRQPALNERNSWRSSRVLKQQYHADCLQSLSHTNGAAVAAWSQTHTMGVDMECVRPRNWSAIATLTHHTDEQDWLAQYAGSLHAQYALWCLKEAIIKASAGEWADLAHVGIRKYHHAWVLCDTQQQLWHGKVWRCEPEWLLACVWQGNGEPQIRTLGTASEWHINQWLKFDAHLCRLPAL